MKPGISSTVMQHVREMKMKNNAGAFVIRVGIGEAGRSLRATTMDHSKAWQARMPRMRCPTVGISEFTALKFAPVPRMHSVTQSERSLSDAFLGGFKEPVVKYQT
jgi:hypothetical protein